MEMVRAVMMDRYRIEAEEIHINTTIDEFHFTNGTMRCLMGNEYVVCNDMGDKFRYEIEKGEIREIYVRGVMRMYDGKKIIGEIDPTFVRFSIDYMRGYWYVMVIIDRDRVDDEECRKKFDVVSRVMNEYICRVRVDDVNEIADLFRFIEEGVNGKW